MHDLAIDWPIYSIDRVEFMEFVHGDLISQQISNDPTLWQRMIQR